MENGNKKMEMWNVNKSALYSGYESSELTDVSVSGVTAEEMVAAHYKEYRI